MRIRPPSGVSCAACQGLCWASRTATRASAAGRTSMTGGSAGRPDSPEGTWNPVGLGGRIGNPWVGPRLRSGASLRLGDVLPVRPDYVNLGFASLLVQTFVGGGLPTGQLITRSNQVKGRCRQWGTRAQKAWPQASGGAGVENSVRARNDGGCGRMYGCGDDWCSI